MTTKSRPIIGSSIGAVALASAIAAISPVSPALAQTVPTQASPAVSTVTIQASGIDPALSGPQPAIGHGGSLLVVSPPISTPAAPTSRAVTAAAAASSFAFLAGQGGSSQASGIISGSGGTGSRKLSVGYSQNTYRDVGLPVIGTKTIQSSGLSQLIELTGGAAAPASGDLKDHNQCTSAKLTGITASGSYDSGTVSVGLGVGSASTDNTISTGTSLNFVKYYTNAFQCKALSASPAKATRNNSGDMNWKNGALSPTSASSSFSW
jgi:hypothetical protein